MRPTDNKQLNNDVGVVAWKVCELRGADMM